MGLRGELYSTKVSLPNRTYFFNVKENRMGDLYLNIVESKNRETGGFDRQSVILFADDLQDFLKGFDESLRILEKEIRQRRLNAKSAARESKGDADSVSKPRKGSRARRDESSPKERPAKERKRVVVKKQGLAPV